MIAPAIIVAVTDGAGRLLLAHNAKFRGNMHGLVAGFVEAGETMEEAVRRELREEVKLEVKNIRYFASQSWPYPNSLMAGFTAELAEGDAVPVPDMREITAAGFYTPSDMPEVPPPGSIARRMIDHWRENYKGTLS
ncbi:MAG: NAD(+) diphosphatase [Lentisphaeria bacterium]|nr:MAG: NAD(+) diphosphatase [Lentisphaeria bacterium]